MHLRTWLATSIFLVAIFAAALVPFASTACTAQTDDLRALDGEWLYVEDRTEGRASEDQQPPMSVKFALRVEKDAVVQVRSKGEERIALDGSDTEVAGKGTISRYRGEWKDGTLTYSTEIVRVSDNSRVALIRKEFRACPDGLLVRVVVGSPAQIDGVALYRHPQDIELPEPAKATIGEMAWLRGEWVGTRGAEGATSIEERWSPPLGGSMLGVSRTVKRGSMRAFEFLRVVERDGGLAGR